jgi:hypothetical protein
MPIARRRSATVAFERPSELADGESAGLVECDRVERANPLERGGVLDEDVVPGADARTDGDRRGRGEPECVRAGDHHRADSERERAG